MSGIPSGALWRLGEGEPIQVVPPGPRLIDTFEPGPDSVVVARRHGPRAEQTAITRWRGTASDELWTGDGAPRALVGTGDHLAWITSPEGTLRGWWTPNGPPEPLPADLGDDLLAWQASDPPALWYVRSDQALVRHPVDQEPVVVDLPSPPRSLKASGATVWFTAAGGLYQAVGAHAPVRRMDRGANTVEAVAEQTACWTAYAQSYGVFCWHHDELVWWRVPYDEGGQNLRGLVVHDGTVYAATPFDRVQRALGLEPVAEKGAVLQMQLP